MAQQREMQAATDSLDRKIDRRHSERNKAICLEVEVSGESAKPESLPEWACELFSSAIIKTHDSESRGQEEAGRTRRTSELFTRSTALKFVNALNKPP